MRFRKLILLIVSVLLFNSETLSAQLIDTINSSLKQKPKFFITLASFGTFIDGDFANFNGIRTGLNFNQRVKFGVGYFALANRAVVSEVSVSEVPNASYITNGELRIHFFTLSAEYLFYKNESPWQFNITPFQLGIGKSGYDYISRTTRTKAPTDREVILLYQPEISAQYTLMKWLGVGLTTGYRITLLRSDKLTQHLNAPTFAIDVRIFVDELVKMLLSPPEEE